MLGWLVAGTDAGTDAEGRMRTRALADGGTTEGRTKFEDSYFHIFIKTWKIYPDGWLAGWLKVLVLESG